MASKYIVLCLLQFIKAATFSNDMDTMSCFGATKAGDANSYNGQYCVNAKSWVGGQCCDFTSAPPTDPKYKNCTVAPQSDGTTYFSEKSLCGKKDTITNRFLREFLLPSNT